MFHLASFYSSLALNSVYAQVNAVADGSLPRNGANQYILPANMRVLAAHGQGVSTSRLQIQAPSLRNTAYPEIYPINVAARTAIADQQKVQTYGDQGPRLLMNETVGLYGSEGAVGASPTNAALWLGERFEPIPPGPIITLVATATITLVDTAWTLGTLSFETQLAAAEYTIVGMECVSDNANYARLVFPGQVNYRPGVPVQDTYGKMTSRDPFRMGRAGIFGRFQFNAPPQVEVFGAAAASTLGTYFLDVIKM